MNVITILCDTLRRDHCGPYHHGQPVSALGDTNQPDWVEPGWPGSPIWRTTRTRPATMRRTIPRIWSVSGSPCVPS